MRMCQPSSLQSPHRRIIDHKHNEVIEPDIMPIRVKPKRQNPFIHHHSLNHQRTQLGHHSRPDEILIICLRDHKSDKGEYEGNDGILDLGLRYGELAGRVMEVETTECDSTSEEGKVIEVVVFVETVGAVNELGIAVIPFQHLVDEVEGRNTG